MGIVIGSGIVPWAVRTVLPNENPRMMCPPARPGVHGRTNVVVASPMRSGTHLMIDLLLNNVEEYRTRPLYVNLDACVYQSTPERNLVSELTSDAGHIVKTHMPAISAPTDGVEDPEVRRIFDDAVIITVRRNRDDVVRSLKNWGWGDSPTFLDDFERDWDNFWAFWNPRETLSVAFESLLSASGAQDVVRQVAGLTATTARRDVRLPLPSSRRRQIYVNKGLTRLLGRRAPRIDTTIQTLKK